MDMCTDAVIGQAAVAGSISTIAGGGHAKPRLGGPAVDVELSLPTDVAIGRDRCLYIADATVNRVWRVTGAGIISLAAGTGDRAFGGDGGPATEAGLDTPLALAADNAGNLFISDQGHNRIRRIAPNGTITTVAGTGENGDTGDGGQATAAKLSSPNGIAVDDAGNLYIAEGDGRRVRRVDSAGTITTLAGTGESGFSGDGGRATQAKLTSAYDVAVDGRGNVFIADAEGQRIREVDATGLIITVAGTGERGSWADGQAALTSALNDPGGVAVSPDGTLFFTEHHGDRLARVAIARTVHLVAGIGRGFSGDGGPALKAAINQPWGITFDSSGRLLYLADTFNSRIRLIVLP